MRPSKLLSLGKVFLKKSLRLPSQNRRFCIFLTLLRQSVFLRRTENYTVEQALLCRTCSSNSRISDLTAFCKEIFTLLNSCLNFTVTSQGIILILRQHRDANLVLRLDGGKLLSTKRVLHKHQNGLRIRHRKLIWRIKCCLWMHRQIRHWLKLKAERRLQHGKILQRCPWLQALRRRYIGLLLSLQQTYIVSLIVLRRSFVLHGFRLTWLDAHVIVAVKLLAIFDLILRHRYLRSRFYLTLPYKFSILRMNESENFSLIVVKVRLSLKYTRQSSMSNSAFYF